MSAVRFTLFGGVMQLMAGAGTFGSAGTQLLVDAGVSATLDASASNGDLTFGSGLSLPFGSTLTVKLRPAGTATFGPVVSVGFGQLDVIITGANSVGTLVCPGPFTGGFVSFNPYQSLAGCASGSQVCVGGATSATLDTVTGGATDLTFGSLSIAEDSSLTLPLRPQTGRLTFGALSDPYPNAGFGLLTLVVNARIVSPGPISAGTIQLRVGTNNNGVPTVVWDSALAPGGVVSVTPGSGVSYSH